MKMQFKTWNSLTIVAAFAIVGVVTAAAYSLTIPDQYRSTAIIKVQNAELQKVLSRAVLTRLINEEDLYKSERASEPIEDVIEKMKSQDVRISPFGKNSFAISFTAHNPQQAQRIAERLGLAFNDERTWSMVHLPSAPVLNGPRRSRDIVMGLIAGILAGTLFALFRGLRVWKLASALGIAGATLCGAGSYLLPERYSSSAVIDVDSHGTPDLAEVRLREMIKHVTSTANLEAVASTLRIYPNDPHAARKLSEHLHIEIMPNTNIVLIKFDYTDRFLAQKVVADMVVRLCDESTIRSASKQPPAKWTLELIDPASLPFNPYFPNHRTSAICGIALGFMAAIAFGMKSSRQVHA